MKKSNKTGVPFYSTRGIAWLIVLLVLFAVLGVFGMAKLGVITLPLPIRTLLSDGTEAAAPIAGSPLAPETTGEEAVEALPHERYAEALADLRLPDEQYCKYTVTVSGGGNSAATDYETVLRGDDFFVQTSRDGLILQTVVCTGGTVRLTDHAVGKTVAVPDASFADFCGGIPLADLLTMIAALAAGEPVPYGDGITDYALSITPKISGGENIFRFTCATGLGTAEEYTFSFENAVLLSVTKEMDGETIYRMENIAYRNDLSGINADAIFAE